jgi:NAD(P)-dependent dehydrogenase (short-subunit alcohol dehydrogenase family)
MRFEGKVAIITGSGRGIGRATALLCAAEGAAVVVNGRTKTEVESVAQQINAGGGKALAVVADIGIPETAELLVQTAVREFGRLDILVNNAAAFKPLDFAHDTFAEWMHLFGINLLGAVRCSRAAAAHMIKTGCTGRIVNVSSVHAFVAEMRSSHYDVAKGGLNQLTRTLAVELAPHGILVNGVSPGFVNTAMSVVDGINELETESFRELYVKRRRIPLARAAEPEEIARVIVFLAGPENTYITGQNVVVDGGLTITF